MMITYSINTIQVLGSDETMKELFKESMSTADKWCCCYSVICFPMRKSEIQWLINTKIQNHKGYC